VGLLFQTLRILRDALMFVLPGPELGACPINYFSFSIRHIRKGITINAKVK